MARHQKYWSPESLLVPSLVSGTILTIHDLTPITIPDRHTARNRVFHRALLRRAASSASSIIVPTRYVADAVLRHLPMCQGKVHVIHEGPSLNLGEDPLPRENIVTYLGTIEPRKNVSALIRSFRKVDLPGWRLRIIGKLGWLTADESAEFRSLVQDDLVEWTGWLPDEDVARALAISSILVYPSMDEGFGLPVLEGMAAGCAVLTSDAPALREVAGDAAIYVRRKNLEAELRMQLQRLMSDTALREEMARRARERAEEFSWKHAAEETYACVRGQRRPDA
ncbi:MULTISPECIES: glycosyltransferase family 4 protein [Frankia]